MRLPLQAVVLAAGRGTRMGTESPKVLYPLLGSPLLFYPLEILKEIGISRPVVVVGWGREEVSAWLGNRAKTVVQSPPRGTGHAVLQAKRLMKNFKGPLLVWPADMTLLRRETIENLIRLHEKEGAQATILSSRVPEPEGYGRIVRSGDSVWDIREEADAAPAEKNIHEINTGVYVFQASALFPALEKIQPTNRKKEYYLTDVIRLIREAGGRVQALPGASPEEAQGINSQQDLAYAIRIMNNRTIEKLQKTGVTFVSPHQTFVAPGVRIGAGSVIEPWTYMEAGVRIGKNCRIGPFTKLRSGTVIDDGTIIGSFVEVVRSRIGKKVLAKHLTYLGDAVVGDGTNIGAGTITANYDGKNKNVTRIGKKAFIGVNTVLISPATVGDGGRTGAGAVVTRGTEIKAGEIFAGVPARLLRKRK